MKTTRSIVLVGALLLIGAMLPVAGAHLAQNSANTGSPTSFGFGGAADADPCRHASSDLPTVETYLTATCTSNNGVSGTYVGSTTAGAVDCADATLLSPPSGDGNCDGLVFEGSGQDWGAAGLILCDLEFIDGAGIADEEYIDNGQNPSATGPQPVPDGTWDDGGIGGACHVSTYAAGAPPNANTNPKGTVNNANTVCSGTVYAQDWLLGNDVPLLAACDSAAFSSESLLVGITNCLLPPTDAQCAQDEVANALQFQPGDTFLGCVPDENGGGADTSNLGKGDGHASGGVPVPGYAGGCTNGDTVVFITTLVSTNVFNADSVAGAVDNFGPCGFGGTCPSLTGSGDHVVYHPAGGWIDHFY